MQPSYPADWQISCDHRSPSQLAAWAQTEPQALPPSPVGPATSLLRESLQGLQVMELHSAELFRRYFGEPAP